MVKKCEYCGKPFIVGKAINCPGCGANLSIYNDTLAQEQKIKEFDIVKAEYEHKKKKSHIILTILLIFCLLPFFTVALGFLIFVFKMN